MKIALFTDTYLPNINGVVSSVELTRKKLEEHGHDVYVFCTRPGLLKVVQEGKIIRLPGIEVKQLYGYSLAQPLHPLLLDTIEEYHFDVIHCHTEFGVGLFGSYAAKQLRIPVVRTYHTTYEDYTHYINPLDSETLDIGLKKAVSWLSKVYGDDCVRLIAPSEKTKELLQSYHVKTPIDVIPTGVELDRFKNRTLPEEVFKCVEEEFGRRRNEKICVYVGRIAEEKSIDMLIRAFGILKKENAPIRLVVIGGGPDLESLKDYAASLGLEDTVTFLGPKPNVEIPAYYQSADCFCSASTSETQGMTYIEALASGIPVFGRYDEVLEDLIQEDRNGYFFDDEEELAIRMSHFLSLSDEELLQRKKEAVSSVLRYDADVFVTEILKVYGKAIEEYEAFRTIEKIRLKDDYVVLNLRSIKGEEEKISVSLDDFYNEGLRVNDRIAPQTYAKLKTLEQRTLAYSFCLKRLANKDYTVSGIRDFLTRKYTLSEEETEEILSKLKSLSLLDDQKYARSRFEALDRAFFSKRSIRSRLEKDGVEGSLIDLVMNEKETDESFKARHAAEKYQNGIRHKSLSVKKQTILRRLVQDGFNYDTAKEAVDSLDFSSETFEEKDLLKKEAAKARKRLSRKYEGTELRNRLYYTLFSKGFKSEAIYAVINETEE